VRGGAGVGDVTRLTVEPDAEAVARGAAERIAAVVREVAGDGAVHVGVAGGTTPGRAHELLAAMDLPWSRVHLWLGDERCVPADHEDANRRMLEETLVARLAGERPVVHEVRGELGPEDAAWLYARELAGALGPEPVLDVVVLGLGPDGHTASLFPGHPEADAAHAPVIPVRGSPKPPPERISLTLPVLRRARTTLLLATGEGKRSALDRVRAGDASVPAGRLGDGLDEILCDEAAAGG
jgi:6-phosphogluconolactonase